MKSEKINIPLIYFSKITLLEIAVKINSILYDLDAVNLKRL